MARNKEFMQKVLNLFALGVLGLGICLLITVLFSFQVKSTEYAIVTSWGEVSAVYGHKKENGKNIIVDDGGLWYRWPTQNVYKYDNRIHSFKGREGKLEETSTADEKNVIVGMSLTYRIVDPEIFFNTLTDITKAEKQIAADMRSARGEFIGQYKFGELINVDADKIKTDEICQKIKAQLNGKLQNYGLHVYTVSLTDLNIPESITEAVYARMKSDREREANKYINGGEAAATKIIDVAASEAGKKIAIAEAYAQKVRAEGDAEAAKFYKEFEKNPELAAFLKKLEALRKVTSKKTTLILDTSKPPFDLLGEQWDSKTVFPKNINAK